jgi:pimeloyl-ACP methyl ester carboxylesterase
MAWLNWQYAASIPFHLTVRQYAAGKGLGGFVGATGLTDKVRLADSGRNPLDEHKGHLTILVHGYNNSQVAINEAWRDLASTLAASRIPLDDLVAFYWPGDQWSSTVASALAYPLQIPVAKGAAERLSAYLLTASASRPLTISFIAHSLGCLVVLETIATLAASKSRPLTVDGVLLMAAAVPQGLCKRDLGPYGQAWPLGADQRVLFSTSDTVLGRVFHMGQRAAEFVGLTQAPKMNSFAYRSAVGRDGGPQRRWSHLQSLSAEGYKHGDYWTKGESREEIMIALRDWHHLLGSQMSMKRRENNRLESDLAETPTYQVPRQPGPSWRTEERPRW